MKILLHRSDPVPRELIFCYVMKALAMEIVLLADTSLFWFLLAYMIQRSVILSLGKAQVNSLQDEAERLENDSGHYQHGKVEDNNAFGESEWSDDGESDEENDDTDDSSGQGSNDSGEEDDDGGEGEDSDGDEEEDEDESDCTESSEEDEDEVDKPLLNHARKVYTSNVYRAFEHEFRKSRALNLEVGPKDWDERGLVSEYKLKKMGHFEREHELTAYPCDGEMNCSCNYFSHFGILCCHAIAVLESLCINEIPNFHLTRWMKIDNLLEEKTCFQRVKSGASKDDISTVYQERKEDIYKDFVHVNFNYLRTASTDDIPFIFGDYRREPPKATKDDCYPLYQKKQKFNYTDNALVGTPMLWHAKNIYIPEVFELFRVEYKKSEYLMTNIDSTTVYGSGNSFHVECKVYKPGHHKGYVKVSAESDDGTVKCSCKKFDSDRILCSHAIAVLDYLCIVRIPSQYIVPQFVRDVSLCVNGEIHGPQYGPLIWFAWWMQMGNAIQKFQKMASLSDEALDAIEKCFAELRAKLDDDLCKPCGGSSKIS